MDPVFLRKALRYDGFFRWTVHLLDDEDADLGPLEGRARRSSDFDSQPGPPGSGKQDAFRDRVRLNPYSFPNEVGRHVAYGRDSPELALDHAELGRAAHVRNSQQSGRCAVNVRDGERRNCGFPTSRTATAWLAFVRHFCSCSYGLDLAAYSH